MARVVACSYFPRHRLTNRLRKSSFKVLAFIGVAALFVSSAVCQDSRWNEIGNGSRTSVVQRDGQAVSVLARMMAATGWNAAKNMKGAVATGATVVGLGGNGATYAFSVKARPGNQFRIESATDRRVQVRNGDVTKTSADGKNSFSDSGSDPFMVPNLPFFTGIVDLGDPFISATYLGTEVVQGQTAHRIELQGTRPTKDVPQSAHSFPHVILSVSADNFLPLKLEYSLESSIHPGVRQPVAWLWSDYRSVQGVMVPFKAQQMIGGVLGPTTTLQVVELDQQLNDSDFDLQ